MNSLKNLLIITFFWANYLVFSQKVPYLIYNSNAEIITYEKMVNECLNADIIFFGEIHNNSMCHWLKLQIIKDIYQANKNIIIGAEMFEADNQLILNELIDKQIHFSKFEEDARLWPNYKTDYRPIVEFCYKNNIPIIATNIPRRYASKVAYSGLQSLDSLTSEAKKYIAPLPIVFDSTLNCYKNMLQMKMSKFASGFNLAQAQAIKDATMAYFITLNLKNNYIFFHINGAYHSDYFEGIVWYLKKYAKTFNKKENLKIITITTKEFDNIYDKVQIKNLGNIASFIIAIQSDMIKTY